MAIWMKKVQFLKKLYLRGRDNRQSRPAQILLPYCVSCLNLGAIMTFPLTMVCSSQSTNESQEQQVWDSSLQDLTILGSVEPTRTPTDSFVSISPRVPTSQISRRSFWRKLSANWTRGRGRGTDSSHPIKCSASQLGRTQECLYKPQLMLLDG